MAETLTGQSWLYPINFVHVLTEIWEFARWNDFCIVTQDADFAERSRLLITEYVGFADKVIGKEGKRERGKRKEGIETTQREETQFAQSRGFRTGRTLFTCTC